MNLFNLKRHQRPGRHRAGASRPAHQGWEGREHELQLLAGDGTETTQPIQGLPILPTDAACPVDQCGWEPDPATNADRDGQILEHLRWHSPVDFLRTITRLRVANTKLQEALP